MRKWSPELETLDQLPGGELSFDIVRLLFPNEERFRAGILAMLDSGEIRLLLNEEVIPHWRWRPILEEGGTCKPFRFQLTKQGTPNI